MKKEEIITQIAALLSQLLETDSKAEITKADEPVEMLTIKECTEVVKGFPSIRYVSLWHRRRFRTFEQVRENEEKYLFLKQHCLNTLTNQRNHGIFLQKSLDFHFVKR